MSSAQKASISSRPTRSALGQSVSLSADGNTAVVGGSSDNNLTGAVWLFTRVAGVWGQDGAKLTASDENGHAIFGWSAAMTSDGNEFLVGGQGDSGGLGAAWVFASAPAVRTVTPGSGPTAGGTAVTIAGDNLLGASAVHFGPSAAGSFRVVSANQIDAVAPPGAAGAVDVTVTTSAGTSAAGAADTFTYVPPPSVSAVSPNSATTAGGSQVTVASPAAPRPVLTRLSESHRTWRLGNRLATASRRRSTHEPPIGTAYSFALNTSATVRLDFTQRLTGRTVKATCVAQTKRNKHRRSCVRITSAGTLAFSLAAGAHKIHFDGRLSRSKRLLLGRYTVLLTAGNAAGQSSHTRSLSFAIVR